MIYLHRGYLSLPKALVHAKGEESMRVIDLAMRLSGLYPLEVLNLKGVSQVFDDHSTWVLHGLRVPDDQHCVFVEFTSAPDYSLFTKAIRPNSLKSM